MSQQLINIIEASPDKNLLLVIVNGKVYDLTNFAVSHPGMFHILLHCIAHSVGGQEVLYEFNGQDVTKYMKDDAIHFHSPVAFEILKDYYSAELTQQVMTKRDVKQLVAVDDDELKRERLFDHDKPLFWQLWTMDISKEDYMRLVHTPHHAKESVRFFASDFLEVLSRTVWWVIPIIWLPVIGLLIKYSSQHIGIMPALAAASGGVFLWSAIEYILHRFVFHIDDYLPDHSLFLMLHFTFHGVHHYFPMDRLRLVFPPVLCVIIATMLYGIFSIFLPHFYAVGMISGGLLGYVGYDMTHYYIHHGEAMGTHLSQMKSYHLDHHYKDFTVGYGITTKFWDRIFGTVGSIDSGKSN